MEIKSTFEYLKVLDRIAELIDKRSYTPESKQKLRELMLAVKKFESQSLIDESPQERLINDFFAAPHLLN
ncbi:MAG: hypothetical protein ACKOXB_07360 [Flavobacteriales bacterium]